MLKRILQLKGFIELNFNTQKNEKELRNKYNKIYINKKNK